MIMLSLWYGLTTKDGRNWLFAKSEYPGVDEWLRAVWCRLRNHPAGIVFYSSGFEPDMRCKNCGDDLG